MKLATWLLAAIAATGVVTLASGCASPAAPSDTTVATLDESLESVESESAVRTESTFVIRDAQTFERIWTQVFSRRTTREMPAIDFRQQMVVIATMGPQPTTGYGIRFTGVRRGARGLIVGVETLSPGPDCVVSPTVTFPVALARLRRFDGQIGFEFTRTTRTCGGR